MEHDNMNNNLSTWRKLWFSLQIIRAGYLTSLYFRIFIFRWFVELILNFCIYMIFVILFLVKRDKLTNILFVINVLGHIMLKTTNCTATHE